MSSTSQESFEDAVKRHVRDGIIGKLNGGETATTATAILDTAHEHCERNSGEEAKNTLYQFWTAIFEVCTDNATAYEKPVDDTAGTTRDLSIDDAYVIFADDTVAKDLVLLIREIRSQASWRTGGHGTDKRLNIEFSLSTGLEEVAETHWNESYRLDYTEPWQWDDAHKAFDSSVKFYLTQALYAALHKEGYLEEMKYAGWACIWALKFSRHPYQKSGSEFERRNKEFEPLHLTISNWMTAAAPDVFRYLQPLMPTEGWPNVLEEDKNNEKHEANGALRTRLNLKEWLDWLSRLLLCERETWDGNHSEAYGRALREGIKEMDSAPTRVSQLAGEFSEAVKNLLPDQPQDSDVEQLVPFATKFWDDTGMPGKIVPGVSVSRNFALSDFRRSTQELSQAAGREWTILLYITFVLPQERDSFEQHCRGLELLFEALISPKVLSPEDENDDYPVLKRFLQIEFSYLASVFASTIDDWTQDGGRHEVGRRIDKDVLRDLIRYLQGGPEGGWSFVADAEKIENDERKDHDSSSSSSDGDSDGDS
ncbi:hypothetical protein BKA67DRAFT_657644 [Truncatella angustata]|uniref:Uncharacterized protein n=1 Tax=Truncatella angustata TaxID=152316 RepID=A0A9P8UP90_9PEZI|nr:uncharacterized protein BKA67DRAFT_657644 [Truncatella angustata]KAH6655722.1 hypothetical protein BKA67DRAFT_657644 [Truncatella angustata]KAH8200477.1 hypothetical protein TruAng_005370 [Truncatella angustata]